jgi:hypothetical protein
VLDKKFQTLPFAGRNYRALALGKIPNWGWHLNDIKSKCLSEVVETFNWHLVRTSTFALLPAWIAHEAIREQLWIDHATVKDGGSLTPDLIKYAITPLPPNVEAEFTRLAKAYRSTDEDVGRALLDVIGINFIENSTTTSSAVALGIEVVFESVVRESWTAFEDLVRELWAVLLDNDDGTVAARVIGVLRKPHKGTVPTFNVKTHPGSFQVEMRQVVFQKMDCIRKLYAAALGPVAETLFDSVEAGYIHVLNAFRNVLAHKRGRADATFRDQIANYPEFNKIKLRQPIVLDGENTRKMRDAAMVLGRKLVELADKELQRQKP